VNNKISAKSLSHH